MILANVFLAATWTLLTIGGSILLLYRLILALETKSPSPKRLSRSEVAYQARYRAERLNIARQILHMYEAMSRQRLEMQRVRREASQLKLHVLFDSPLAAEQARLVLSPFDLEVVQPVVGRVLRPELLGQEESL